MTMMMMMKMMINNDGDDEEEEDDHNDYDCCSGINTLITEGLGLPTYS